VSVDLLEDLEPADLDLSFEKYHHEQLEAIEKAAYGDKRFQALALPTGGGKSLVGISLHKLLGLRCVVLTSTKGLQQQYLSDFERIGMVDVRGKANYDCHHNKGMDCDVGAAIGCPFTNGHGCMYEMARGVARDSELVITNYKYWMGINEVGQGRIERTAKDANIYGDNPVELLVVDEAHRADQEVSSYLGCRIYEKDIKGFGAPKTDKMTEWTKFTEDQVDDLAEEMHYFTLEIHHLRTRGELEKKHTIAYHRMKILLRNLKRISTAGDDWICEKQTDPRYGRYWQFDIVWPGHHTENVLFNGIGKVVLMSATIRPNTMGLLGIAKGTYQFHEWDRIFPADRHRIYYLPAKTEGGKDIRLRYGMPESELECWVEHIDTILDARDDRKGLIDTVSYDRQQFLMDHSRNAHRMMGNTNDPDSPTATDMADHFRESKTQPPPVLVSPSFGTGWDFPLTECEFIIVAKIPFKPSTGKVMKARDKKSNKNYGKGLTMQDLIQICGRGMRLFVDRCEVFIVDGNLLWFLYSNKRLASRWFVKAVTKIQRLPKRPEKL